MPKMNIRTREYASGRTPTPSPNWYQQPQKKNKTSPLFDPTDATSPVNQNWAEAPGVPGSESGSTITDPIKQLKDATLVANPNMEVRGEMNPLQTVEQSMQGVQDQFGSFLGGLQSQYNNYLGSLGGGGVGGGGYDAGIMDQILAQLSQLMSMNLAGQWMPKMMQFGMPQNRGPQLTSQDLARLGRNV
jgi:hypothetical protein